MLPKPLNDHRHYSDAQSLLVSVGYLKKHDLDIEWRGNVFMIRGFTDLEINVYTEYGKLLGFSIDAYNSTVAALKRTNDAALLNTIYVMINSISPVGLLRRQLFGEKAGVGKVDARSSHEDFADCRVHMDLVGNLYNAAKENPLSYSNAKTMRNARKAFYALKGMERMYAKAREESKAESAWRKNGAAELEYRNMGMVEVSLRDESDVEDLRRRSN